MDVQLFRQLGLDADLTAEAGNVASIPCKSTLTSRLAPAPQVVFRVADPATARALGEAMSGSPRIQREADGAAPGARDDNGVMAGAEHAVATAASSSGNPLPEDVRARFEASTGADLGAVRVHTGAESQTAAAAVGAKAYTVGQDIHFGAGEYRPADPFGLHLLAHEVAHTVQQAGGAPHRQHKLEVSAPNDAAEVEADRAADRMVHGERVESFSMPIARQAVHRTPGMGHAPPPPPGMITLKTLQPVAAAVKAGEQSGEGSIPSPGGLFDVAERNFSRYAQHCTNIQAHYHAKAGGVDLPLVGKVGDNHHFASFAETAGSANKFCENGAVQAGNASSAIGNWIPLLQSSQERWGIAKKTATASNIDISVDDKGGTSLDDESVQLDGESNRAQVKMVSAKDPGPLPANATPAQKAHHDKVKQESDADTASGKNMRQSEKVLLDEATTNFEQSVAEMNKSRSSVVRTRQRAVSALSAAKVAANQERLKSAEDQKKAIDEIFALVDTAQGAIEKGMGMVNEAEGMELMSDGMGGMHKVSTTEDAGLKEMKSTGEAALKIKASKVAELVLRLDGTIPTIEGEIAACKSRDANLNGIIKAEQIAADGKDYAAALKQYREALGKMPERIQKYIAAHRAFAEAVNQALIKRGILKPGDSGVEKTMQLLADVRVAQAATSSAIAATDDVAESVAAVAGLNAAPEPDICQLGDMVKGHNKAFTSAPGHIAAIKAVLTAREARLKSYVDKLAL